MTRLTVRMPDDLHRRLRAVSERQGVSISQTVVSILETALPRGESAPTGETPIERQRSAVRAALTDLAVQFDGSPPTISEDELKALRDSLPVLDPPLSRTIIEEREDQRF